MAADVLATQGANASAATVLTYPAVSALHELAHQAT